MSAQPKSCSYCFAAFSQLRSCAMPAACSPFHAGSSFLHVGYVMSWMDLCHILAFCVLFQLKFTRA